MKSAACFSVPAVKPEMSKSYPERKEHITLTAWPFVKHFVFFHSDTFGTTIYKMNIVKT